MLHSNFDILDKPWWTLSVDTRDVKYFVSNTENLQMALLLAIDKEDDASFWKGYIDLHRERYLLECISAESDVDIDSIKQLLKKPSFFRIFLDWICKKVFAKSCIIVPDRFSSRMVKKAKNIRDTITNISPSVLIPDL